MTTMYVIVCGPTSGDRLLNTTQACKHNVLNNIYSSPYITILYEKYKLMLT